MRRSPMHETPIPPMNSGCCSIPRVFTQGVAGKAEHILAAGDIPVIPVDRGGQVTYHGPGQWVVYLLIDLKRRALACARW
jgi:lipoyl(octanoyl) transferase